MGRVWRAEVREAAMTAMTSTTTAVKKKMVPVARHISSTLEVSAEASTMPTITLWFLAEMV